MIARVEAIESKSQFRDGQRRIALRIKGADAMWSLVKLPENALGIVGLALDDEIEVTFRPRREQAKSEAA